MAYTATHKYARISARKVRHLASLVRGKFADEALISCVSSHTVVLACWRKLLKVHLEMLNISRLLVSMILSWSMHESMVVRCLSGISQERVVWPTKSRKGCHTLRFHWIRLPWQVPTAAKPLVRQELRNSHGR